SRHFSPPRIPVSQSWTKAMRGFWLLRKTAADTEKSLTIGCQLDWSKPTGAYYSPSTIFKAMPTKPMAGWFKMWLVSKSWIFKPVKLASLMGGLSHDHFRKPHPF
ncbi:MAG: hypothetical protein WCO91_13590, partial [Gemmataceae bacterium]